MSALIRFENVSKRFGRQVVLADVNLEINRGEAMVILGESGTGKSVLAKMLIGLVRPDTGKIWFDGQNITELDEPGLLEVRKRIAMCFQGNALFDSMTIGENVAYPLREHTTLSEEQIAQTVRDKLCMVSLEGIENKIPSQLSGGMRKRVALARAIAAEPEVLIYDEPTTGLDPPNTRKISELICTLNEKLKITSIVITHDMACAFFIADRVALLSDQKISAVMTKNELLASGRDDIREFVEAMPRW